jgi:hypothetical protein
MFALRRQSAFGVVPSHAPMFAKGIISLSASFNAFLRLPAGALPSRNLLIKPQSFTVSAGNRMLASPCIALDKFASIQHVEDFLSGHNHAHANGHFLIF